MPQCGPARGETIFRYSVDTKVHEGCCLRMCCDASAQGYFIGRHEISDMCPQLTVCTLPNGNLLCRDLMRRRGKWCSRCRALALGAHHHHSP